MKRAVIASRTRLPVRGDRHADPFARKSGRQLWHGFRQFCDGRPNRLSAKLQHDPTTRAGTCRGESISRYRSDLVAKLLQQLGSRCGLIHDLAGLGIRGRTKKDSLCKPVTRREYELYKLCSETIARGGRPDDVRRLDPRQWPFALCAGGRPGNGDDLPRAALSGTGAIVGDGWRADRVSSERWNG